MKRSVIRVTAFICILITVLLGVNHVLSFKYSYNINDVYNFYSLEDNSVDVLILGTSHAYSNINTGTLWDEYGMSACIFAGSEQATWNTYYYLKEALKTQKPKLIVLEAFGTTLDYDYAPPARVVQNTYGLKWSKNKIDAIKASVTPSEQLEFLLSYGRYHTRYSDLTEEDFTGDINSYITDECMGYVFLTNQVKAEHVETTGIVDKKPINKKAEKYFRKTIELAKSQDIPVMVLVTPYVGITPDEQAMFNTVADIAAEYQVPYVNYNNSLKETGINYTEDSADYSHFNYKGAAKFAKTLGDYIQKNFQVPDHRGEIEYARWQQNADYLNEISAIQDRASSEDMEEKIKDMQEEDKMVFISIDGDVDTTDETVLAFLNWFGIAPDSSGGVYYKSYGSFVWHTTEPTATFVTTPNHDIKLQHDADGTNSITVDGVGYKAVQTGINVVVYDKSLDMMTNWWGIDFANEYKIVNRTAL